MIGEVEDSASSASQLKIGEKVNGRRHFPEYTEGCWGATGHKMCWICRFRYIRAMFRLFRRH